MSKDKILKSNQTVRVDFKKKWGIRCNDIAEAEGVTPEAIRMRVKLFGNPWQRAKKPSKFEKKYGKTILQIAQELGVHPVTIARRENLYGDVYHVSPQKKDGTVKHTWNKGINLSGKHWSENPKSGFYGDRCARPWKMNKDDIPRS
tara:strand:+ start:434 stop:871 length:438 start_codon:yes stop_codon:yes gene_type:complete